MVPLRTDHTTGHELGDLDAREIASNALTDLVRACLKPVCRQTRPGRARGARATCAGHGGRDRDGVQFPRSPRMESGDRCQRSGGFRSETCEAECAAVGSSRRLLHWPAISRYTGAGLRIGIWRRRHQRRRQSVETGTSVGAGALTDRRPPSCRPYWSARRSRNERVKDAHSAGCSSCRKCVESGTKS